MLERGLLKASHFADTDMEIEDPLNEYHAHVVLLSWWVVVSIQWANHKLDACKTASRETMKSTLVFASMFSGCRNEIHIGMEPNLEGARVFLALAKADHHRPPLLNLNLPHSSLSTSSHFITFDIVSSHSNLSPLRIKRCG